MKNIRSELPRPIHLLWLAFVTSTLLLYLFASTHRHLGPHFFGNLFPGPLLEDLVVYLSTFRSFHTAQFFHPDHFSGFAYPPGAAVVYRAFYALPRLKVGYFTACVIWTLFGIASVYRAFTRRGLSSPAAAALALSGVLAFPLVFLVQRGNIEIVLWIVSTLGILAYLRGRPYLAAVLWGIAACIKIYPILLVGLFLGRRLRGQTGPFLVGIGTAILCTVAALWYVGPSIGIASHGFLQGVQGFQGSYAQTVRTGEIGFDHSLFSIVKLLAILSGSSAGPLLHPYYLVAGAIALLVFFLRVRHLPFANRLVFITVGFTLLPPVSYEYSLVHLYAPAALLLLSCIIPAGDPERNAGSSRPSIAALACLAVLFLPINLFVVRGLLYAGQIQALLLLLLGALAAAHPWPRPSLHPPQTPGRATIAST